MKVFIVVPDWGYEGYGEPVGAYSTKRKAENAKKKFDGECEIVELVINANLKS